MKDRYGLELSTSSAAARGRLCRWHRSDAGRRGWGSRTPLPSCDSRPTLNFALASCRPGPPAPAVRAARPSSGLRGGRRPAERRGATAREQPARRDRASAGDRQGPPGARPHPPAHHRLSPRRVRHVARMRRVRRHRLQRPHRAGKPSCSHSSNRSPPTTATTGGSRPCMRSRSSRPASWDRGRRDDRTIDCEQRPTSGHGAHTLIHALFEGR